MTFQEWLQTPRGRMITFETDTRKMLKEVWDAASAAQLADDVRFVETHVVSRIDGSREVIRHMLPESKTPQDNELLAAALKANEVGE